MVVADPVLVARRGPGGLDAPDEAFVGQDAEGVVHRLAGDDADLGPYDLGDVVRRAVRSTGHRRQNGQALSRDLDTVSAKEIGFLVRHDRSMCPFLDCVKSPLLDCVKTSIESSFFRGRLRRLRPFGEDEPPTGPSLVDEGAACVARQMC